MDNYTMTFKYDGYFDLPDDPEIRDREVPGMVLEKLQNGDFELVDFNLSENYNEGNAENYIHSHLHRSIVEIRLDLKMRELKSRRAIFERCLQALEHNATGIILVHNHPSGVLQESEPDRQITRQLKAGGDALSIKVLDHVIVTEKGYLSFADKGIL